MGNLMAAVASIGVPLFTHSVTVPFLFHPSRWGGMPWHEPSWLVLGIVTLLCNVATLMGLGTLSGLMTTKRECNKMDPLLSVQRSIWLVVGYIVGNIFLLVMPFIKAPFLPFTFWLPYSAWLVHGFLLSGWILLFGAIGNSVLRQNVCRGVR